MLTSIFQDKMQTQQFIAFLGELKKMYHKQQEQASEAYITNDEPISRAVALQFKGKVNCINDLIYLLEQVNK